MWLSDMPGFRPTGLMSSLHYILHCVLLDSIGLYYVTAVFSLLHVIFVPMCYVLHYDCYFLSCPVIVDGAKCREVLTDSLNVLPGRR